MKKYKNIIPTILGFFLAFLWLVPLIWLIGTAFTKANFTMSLIPTTGFTLDNIKYVWQNVPFGKYYMNTIAIVVMTFTVQCITGTLAAYALATMKFRGEKLVFLIIFIQIIIPNDVLIIPNSQTLSDLRLTDTKLGIMLPFFGSAFGIFLLRQTFKTIPITLSEAAIIDGCSTMQVIRNVYLPSSKTAYISFGLVSVSYHWNNFLWPLIVTNSPENRTVTVGLALFAKSKEAIMQWANVCAATFIIIIPLVLAFFIFQKKFINSFVASGIK